MQRHLVPAVLAWLAAALLALGAWLALPRERAKSGPPVHALLVDVSDSAIGRDFRGSYVEDRIQQCRAKAVAQGLEVLAIAFGHGARQFDLAQGGTRDFGSGEDRSDLAAALELADVLGGARLSSVEIVSDGSWTGVDPARVAAQLATRGVRIELVENVRDGFDAYVAPIASPIRVRRGEPVLVQFETWRAMGTAGHHNGLRELVVGATLTDGSVSTRREVRVPVSKFERGPNATRVDVEFPPLTNAHGSIVVEVRLDDGQGARIGRTDDSRSTARAQVIADGVLSIGVVGERVARRAFVDSLSTANADFAFVELDDARAPSLAGIDALVTVDAAFDRDSAAAVDAFVRAGGGWVDFASARLAAGERPSSAALAPARDDDRPRELVILVDSSGSMAGPPAQSARAALVRLIERAPIAYGLSTIWFGEDARTIDLGRPGARAEVEDRRAFARNALNTPEPRGPTRIWTALDAFARDVDASRRTLAVLVSDGRDPDRGNVAARARALREKLTAQGVEFAVVAVGSDPDRELLAALAGDPSRFVEVGALGAEASIDALADGLERALASGAIVELPEPRSAARTDSGGAFAAPYASLSTPALLRRVRARAASGAQVVWASPPGSTSAPILAFARSGVGVAAGFAFVPDDTWITAPTEITPALATAVRAVAPPPDRSRPRLVERDGESVLEGVSADAPAIVRAELASADGGRALGAVDLYAARAGRDPLRERSAPLPEALGSLAAGGAVTARVALGGEPLSLSFSAPRAPEFARPPRTFVPPAARVEARRSSAPAAHPLAPGVLLAGLLALAAAAATGFFSRSRRAAA